MNFTRIAALAALPGLLSLAACAGGSTATFANATGNLANVRIVNGAPGAGPLDIYFQTTGSGAPSNPIISALPFGVGSDFIKEPAAAGNLIAQTAGGASPGSGGRPVLSCPFPQMGTNAKYSLVVVSVSGALNCELFQDFDYTGGTQFRAHNASPNSALSSGGGFGTIVAASAPPGTPFTVQVAGPQGTLGASASGSATGFTQAQPTTVAPFTGSITFAVGTASSGTIPSVATLDSRSIFAPNGKAQPNTSGGLNVAGSAGTSIFALDCSAAVAPNVNCTGGVALVGYTDNL